MSSLSPFESRALEAIRTAPGGSTTYDTLTRALGSDARSVFAAVGRLLDQGLIERTANVITPTGALDLRGTPPEPGTLAHRALVHVAGHPGDGFGRIRTALQVLDASVLRATLDGLARAGLIVRTRTSLGDRYALPDRGARRGR